MKSRLTENRLRERENTRSLRNELKAKLPPRICLRCPKTFKPTSPHSRFCSTCKAKLRAMV